MENYKLKSTQLDFDIDGENHWYYYDHADHPWNIITHCWNDHKTKYFKHVKNFNYVVTAGAHVGLHVRFYAKMFKTVYAFEPDPFNFYCLVNNSQSDNVVKLQCALGSEHKMISLQPVDHHLTLHVSESKPTDYIPMITIDSLNLPGCDFLQLDIENYELNALTGGLETIKKYRPVVVMENGDTPEIIEIMKDLNYEVDCKSEYDTIWIPQ